MKSTAARSSKSPLPATASTAPSVSGSPSSAPPLTPKSTRVPRVKPPSPPAAVVPQAAEPAAPAPKPPTIITAKVDVGFGNSVYLRGDGPGLCWNKGVPLTCVANDKWTIAISGVDKPVTFKFLCNDETWSRGEDFVAAPGASAEFEPAF